MRRSTTKDFRHATLVAYPDRSQVAGITLLDEKPGFTGIYLRTHAGGLFPARTVDRSAPGGHHDNVVNAWLRDEGKHIDLRKRAKSRKHRSAK